MDRNTKCTIVMCFNAVNRMAIRWQTWKWDGPRCCQRATVWSLVMYMDTFILIWWGIWNALLAVGIFLQWLYLDSWFLHGEMSTWKNAIIIRVVNGLAFSMVTVYKYLPWYYDGAILIRGRSTRWCPQICMKMHLGGFISTFSGLLIGTVCGPWPTRRYGESPYGNFFVSLPISIRGVPIWKWGG